MKTAFTMKKRLSLSRETLLSLNATPPGIPADDTSNNSRTGDKNCACCACA